MISVSIAIGFALWLAAIVFIVTEAVRGEPPTN